MPWENQRTETITRELHPDARRLTELSLALVIPWNDGFPQYYLAADGSNMAERMGELLDATADEVLPWQL